MSGYNMGDSANLIPVLRSHFGLDNERIHTGVEVGVHVGGLSAALLREFPLLFLWMVDSWQEFDANHPYRLSGDSLAKLTYDQQTANMNAAKAATAFAEGRRAVLRLPSLTAVERIPCKRLAFVFLDGDHTGDAVEADIAAWWPRVEPGGLFAGHDYKHRRYKGLTAAVERFAASAGLPLIEAGSVWAVAKPGDQFIPPPPPPLPLLPELPAETPEILDPGQ